MSFVIKSCVSFKVHFDNFTEDHNLVVEIGEIDKSWLEEKKFSVQQWQLKMTIRSINKRVLMTRVIFLHFCECVCLLHK